MQPKTKKILITVWAAPTVYVSCFLLVALAIRFFVSPGQKDSINSMINTYALVLDLVLYLTITTIPLIALLFCFPPGTLKRKKKNVRL